MNTILMAFQQAGGVNALLPLMEHWRERYTLSAGGRQVACRQLRRGGMIVDGCDGLAGFGNAAEEIRRWFDRADPQVVITDTIDMSRSADAPSVRQFWKEAAERDIPSIAYVDCWWAYRRRFQMPTEHEPELLPDIIAVIDALAADEMELRGFPPERLAILGSPLYDRLRKLRDRVTPQQQRGFRNKMDIGPDRLMIAFASQPFHAAFGSEETWGFNAQTVLRDMVEHLCTLDMSLRRQIVLVVMLHPEEDASLYEPLTDGLRADIELRFIADGNPHEIISSSNLVTGIFSILLSEAVILGRPVISLQPNLINKDMLITNLVGATKPVRTDDDYQTHFLRAVCEPGYRQSLIERQQRFRIVSDTRRRWDHLVENICQKRMRHARS